MQSSAHKSTFQQLNPFGQSGLMLPSLGFGAAPIGNLYRAMSDQDTYATVNSALQQGVRYFDTAPHYGFGLSEVRLGSVLAKQSLNTIVSSKVGRLLVPASSHEQTRHGFVDAPALEPVFDYSYDAVMRSFESSLRRLQTDKIDILLAHDLGAATHGNQHTLHFKTFMEGGYRAMQELRESGVVSAIGLGANEWQVCEQALEYGDFDGFLLAGRYSLLEQSACDSFFPLCAKRGASVIVGGAFNSGILATGVAGTGPFYYNYEPAPAEIIAKVTRIESVCREFAVPLPAAALQFPLVHPQVASLVAGLASVAQVEQAIAWLGVAIPLEFWDRLRELALLHPDAPVPYVLPVSELIND